MRKRNWTNTKTIGFSTEHSAKARSIGAQEECSPTLRAGAVPAVSREISHAEKSDSDSRVS